MKTEKSHKIIFWTATSIIFLFEGVMPALTSQTEMAKEGIRHLGYPEYFGNALVAFKIIGAIILVTPRLPNRIKEWAYAGFAFDFIFAFISHWAVDGFGGQTFFPLVILGILAISYIYYHKVASVYLRYKNKVISSLFGDFSLNKSAVQPETMDNPNVTINQPQSS